MTNGHVMFHVHRLEMLAEQPLREAGTYIRVEQAGEGYWAAGNFKDEVRRVIGRDHENVWIPDHVYSYLLDKRGDVFADIVGAANAVLNSPLSVHEDRISHHFVYVLADASMLRDRGLLLSASTPYVDAVIESRSIGTFSIARLFHLSPRRRNQGRAQLWP